MGEKILIIGSSGQIGTELVIELRMIHGNENVIATDLKTSSEEVMNSGPFEYLDVMDEALLRDIVKRYNISQVYLLAALLSATAEKNIELGWQLNTRSHSHVLDLAKDGLIKKIFWPSSIAVFGPTTPNNTPQHAIMEPNTVYGISKLAGERWNEYYFNKFGVDVRSLRYPGLIGWKSVPGGGTTDYAVDIFYNAIKYGKYTSFIAENTQEVNGVCMYLESLIGLNEISLAEEFLNSLSNEVIKTKKVQKIKDRILLIKNTDKGPS
ncbi:MAG: NAD-dependent epimerase/dehydratase family protein, partial [Flavobacteriales bacterium]|nr:NAD-dependent epimerase/dehydratase family protein [Flavobacteriales bacterium]